MDLRRSVCSYEAMRRRIVVLASLVAWLLCSSASAQNGQREPLLSERAFGLGGAVVGSAAGPSAAYYNPAGLADTPGTSAGATLSLRTFRSYRVRDGYTSVLGVEDLTDSGLLTIPIFVGAVLKFGDRDETNVREHALAAGMFIRNQVDRELLNEDADLSQGIASSLEVFERRETRWFYASYAWRPSRHLSFGLTAALANDDTEYRESWSQGVNLDGGFGGGDGLLEARTARIDTNVMNLAFRVGASWRPSEWIQFSAVFQVPGIELFDGGSALFQRVTANTDAMGDPSGFLRVELDDPDVQSAIPWQLRIGTYARFERVLGFGLDLGITGTQGSVSEPVTPLGEPVPLDGPRPAATYFADRYWADVSFDAALGVEIQITEEVPLRIGSFLEFTGLPGQFGTRETYAPDQVNRVGVNVGVGVRGDRYDFGLGVGYVHGYGNGLRPADPFTGGYVTTDVESHEVSFFLSGVTGAATQLALDTYQAITGRGFSEAVEEDAIDHHVEDVPELRTHEERVDELHDTTEHQMELPRWIHDAADPESDVEDAVQERLEDMHEDEPGEQLLEEMEPEPSEESEAPPS